MEIPNAGISWLYTAGFISSSADMEKNMSSYSPYEKCDVGKGRKQSSSPCSVATAWLSCPEMRKQSQQEELPRNRSEDGQEHVPRTQHGWGFLGTLGGREKVKPRGSQLAVTPALAVWRFLIEVTWLHGFWRAVRGQLQLRWRWNTKTGKYWACRVCDCLSEQGLVGEKIGAGTAGSAHSEGTTLPVPHGQRSNRVAAFCFNLCVCGSSIRDAEGPLRMCLP